MIILPSHRVVVVATPRTGSRSIKEAIRNAHPEGMIVTKPHHDWPHEVARAASGGYEVFTMIREPESQLKSWIGHARFWHDHKKFVQEYRNRYFFYNGGMNIYNQEATRYFVFENGGHQEMLDVLGIDEKLPHIGGSQSSPSIHRRELDADTRRVARARFQNDFELYRNVTERAEERN